MTCHVPYNFVRAGMIGKGLLLALLMLCLCACGSKAEREMHYLQLGKSLLEQNNPDRAAEQFHHVLQLNAANVEAYYQLGLIQETRQQYRAAQEYFTRALERKPDHAQAQAHLARMHLMLGQNPQAGEKANALLKADPANVSAKTVLAQVNAQQGNLGKAIEDLEKAKKPGANPVEFYQELAGFYLRRGQLSKAQAILVEAIEYHPQDVVLQTSLAQAYLQDGKVEKAEAPLQSAIALEPNDFSHHARLATNYVASKQIQKAEAVLRNSLAAAPQDSKRMLALKEFLLYHGSPDAAEAELLGFIQAMPTNHDISFALADLYESTGVPEKAEKIYQGLITQDVSKAVNEKAHAKLAEMYTGIGKASTAKMHIEAALKISRDSPEALAARGRLAMEDRDYNRAIADFRSVLKQFPHSVEYMGLLARAHMQNEEPALARELLFRAAKNNPEHISMRSLFAEYLIQSRDYKAAVEEVEAMSAKFPFDPAVQPLRQRVQNEQHTLAGSEAKPVGIENDLPPNAAVYSRQGKQYLEQKNYDNAIGEFQKALRIAPSAIEPLKGMVQAYLAQGRPDMARARVNAQLRITSPALHQAYYLLGQIHEGQNQPAEAARAYQKSLDINADWDAPYLALARQHYLRGDNKRALSVLDTARNTLPYSETIALHLAAMLEANQQYERAMAEYEKLLTADADLDVAANNLAALLLDKRGDKTSIERALTLTRRFQNSIQPAYLDTLGWALVKSGQASRGLPYLEKALASAPDSPAYHYHAGLAYSASGDKEKAKIHLLKSIAPGAAFSGRDQAKAIAATL